MPRNLTDPEARALAHRLAWVAIEDALTATVTEILAGYGDALTRSDRRVVMGRLDDMAQSHFNRWSERADAVRFKVPALRSLAPSDEETP